MSPIALLTIVIAIPADVPTSAPAHGDRFHVRYVHAVCNLTTAPLKGVKIFLPIPQSDPTQTVENFRVWRGDAPVQYSNRRDAYGQPIARVAIATLAPGEKAEVGFDVDVALRTPPRKTLKRARIGRLSDIPEEIRSQFTGDKRGYYDLADPAIRALADRLAAGKMNLLDQVRAFHDYVADSRNFKYARGGGWDGAAVVLKRRDGSCSELTFLFCALCRSKGIPTRLVGATTGGRRLPHTDTVWHRWAEVYLPGRGWVPVDVTRDRGHPPRSENFGDTRGRMLIVSRTDGGSTLGKSYIGANNHDSKLFRLRFFVWTRLPKPPNQRP